MKANNRIKASTATKSGEDRIWPSALPRMTDQVGAAMRLEVLKTSISFVLNGAQVSNKEVDFETLTDHLVDACAKFSKYVLGGGSNNE